MTEYQPQQMNQEIAHEKNHFPILIQVSILLFVLVGIFGSLLFTDSPTPELPPATQQPLVEREDDNGPTILPTIPNDSVSIQAKAAYVWDPKTQRTLYSKNESEQLPLASITKLMTALLAYELVSENTVATVSQNAINQEGSIGLTQGERLRAKELLELALVSSSNDAAYALAANVGALLGDNEPTSQFVQGMNIRAQTLGLHSMEFWNTTGLDLSTTQPGAVGNARDVSFLVEHIISTYPEILSSTQESTIRVFSRDGEYHDIQNTNELVQKIPNLIGSKTGYTDLAGGNLTVAFDIGLDRPIIITVLGSTRSQRFSDVAELVSAVQEAVE